MAVVSNLHLAFDLITASNEQLRVRHQKQINIKTDHKNAYKNSNDILLTSKQL